MCNFSLDGTRTKGDPSYSSASFSLSFSHSPVLFTSFSVDSSVPAGLRAPSPLFSLLLFMLLDVSISLWPLHLSTLFGWGVNFAPVFSLGVIVCVYPFHGSGFISAWMTLEGLRWRDCVIFSAGVLFVWYWRSGPRQIWPPCECADRCE